MLAIRLLGRPQIVRDGAAVVPPRGHKAWAVLAYLALAERPVCRSELAALLFGDAHDPRGALRWTLAQLRRALGDAVTGDPHRAHPAGRHARRRRRARRRRPRPGTGPLDVIELRRNDHRFLSDRALEACSTYQVESISLLAVRR